MKIYGAAVLLSLACSLEALAQALPPPSRDVFRCEENGRTVYSDSPCLGAKRVDIQPTRGLNKSSGRERVGADVRKERGDEAMAKALEPVFGETAEQRATRHRRAKLSASTRVTCNRLDAEIPAEEKLERGSAGNDLHATQLRLLQLRKRYKELKC